MRQAFLANPELPPLAEPPEMVTGKLHDVLADRLRELEPDLLCIGTHSGSEPDMLGHYARDLMRAPPLQGVQDARAPQTGGHYARDLMRAPPTDLLISKPPPAEAGPGPLTK